jgi:hypothetical protein
MTEPTNISMVPGNIAMVPGKTGMSLSTMVSGALIAGFFVCLAVFLFSGKASAAETSSPNPVVGSIATPVAGPEGQVTAPVAVPVGQVTTPVAGPVQPITAPVAGPAGQVTAQVAGLVGQVTTPVAGPVQPITAPVAGFVGQVTTPVAGLVGQVTTPVAGLVKSVTTPVDRLVANRGSTPRKGRSLLRDPLTVRTGSTIGGVGPMTFAVTAPSYSAGAGAFVQLDAPGGAGLVSSTSGAPTSVGGDASTVLPPVTPAPLPIPPGSGSSSSSASASTGSAVGLLSDKPTVGADLVGWLGRAPGNVLPEAYVEPEESPA